MAAGAESGLIFAHVKQETTARAVDFMAGQAVTILDRLVNYLFLAHGFVALGAEVGALGGQLEAFTSLERVLLGFLLVTGKAVAILDRLVLVFQGANGRMTGRGDARIGKDRCDGQY